METHIFQPQVLLRITVLPSMKEEYFFFCYYHSLIIHNKAPQIALTYSTWESLVLSWVWKMCLTLAKYQQEWFTIKDNDFRLNGLGKGFNINITLLTQKIPFSSHETCKCNIWFWRELIQVLENDNLGRDSHERKYVTTSDEVV